MKKFLFIFFLSARLFSELYIEDNHVIRLIEDENYTGAWNWIQTLPNFTEDEKLFNNLLKIYLYYEMEYEDGFEDSYEEMHKILMNKLKTKK